MTGRWIPGSPVIAEWEWYARDYARGKDSGQSYLGEDWNDPQTIGLDVPADRVVDHLLERVVLPHLGTPKVLLEIGCGAGRFTLPLATRVPRLIAADTSPAMLGLLRRRLPKDASVTTVLLDGRGLAAIEARSIDAAFSYDVFVHLGHHDIFLYLNELARVLVPGGRAVIHHANTFSPLGWTKFTRDHERHLGGLPPRGQFVVMSPDLMRELATRAGLLVDGCVTDVVRRDCITLLGAPVRPPNAG